MSIIAVVAGGQFGSEGKGHVAAQEIAQALKYDRTVLNVRVAGPNAGHTVVDEAGVAYPLRTIPVGAAVDNRVVCAISPGSEIDPPVLFSELDLLRQGGHNVDLRVSTEATILTPEHKEQESAGHLTDRLGSTGKGIGACRADRIWRTATRVGDDQGLVKELRAAGVALVTDWVQFIDGWTRSHSTEIVIEGTQGYGLGLHAGYYPQCTSSDTRAIDFLAMAGVNPVGYDIEDYYVLLCCRVYPIRVAGNSGPLKGETSWEELGLAAERTTVTHKIRRVGNWDADLVAQAVKANGGPGVVRLALTMADQKVPEIERVSGAMIPAMNAYIGLANLVGDVELSSNARVAVVTTSPNTCLWR